MLQAGGGWGGLWLEVRELDDVLRRFQADLLYVSSYYYVCVLILLLYMRPHARGARGK